MVNLRGRSMRLSLVLVAFLALLILWNPSNSPRAAAKVTDPPSVTKNLPGNWTLTVNFVNSAMPPGSSQVQFQRWGGFVNQTPGPGRGFWWVTGQGTFSYAFIERIYSGNTLLYYVSVFQRAKLTSDTTYTASGTGTVYTPGWKRIATDQTTTVATKG